MWEKPFYALSCYTVIARARAIAEQRTESNTYLQQPEKFQDVVTIRCFRSGR